MPGHKPANFSVCFLQNSNLLADLGAAFLCTPLFLLLLCFVLTHKLAITLSGFDFFFKSHSKKKSLVENLHLRTSKSTGISYEGFNTGKKKHFSSYICVCHILSQPQNTPKWHLLKWYPGKSSSSHLWEPQQWGKAHQDVWGWRPQPSAWGLCA